MINIISIICIILGVIGIVYSTHSKNRRTIFDKLILPLYPYISNPLVLYKIWDKGNLHKLDVYKYMAIVTDRDCDMHILYAHDLQDLGIDIYESDYSLKLLHLIMNKHSIYESQVCHTEHKLKSLRILLSALQIPYPKQSS